MPCPLKLVTSEAAPGVWSVGIEGPLDAPGIALLRATIADLFAKDIYRLIIDLEKVTYISSSGFSCFIASLDIARRNGGDLVFSAPSPDVRGGFHLLGLSQLLYLATDAKSAFAFLTQPSAH